MHVHHSRATAEAILASIEEGQVQHFSAAAVGAMLKDLITLHKELERAERLVKQRDAVRAARGSGW